MNVVATLSAVAGRWFGLVIAAAGALGLAAPDAFAWVLPVINWLLALIMLGMGMTLSARDFAAVFVEPRAVALGVLAQFVIMPGIAWALAELLGLPPALAVGLVLVGACPGGTASNVIAYLAGANVALSVTLTSISTLLAPVITPVLTLVLAGQWMDVSAGAMVTTVLQVIAAPLVLGVLAHRFLPRAVAACVPALPLVSVTAIALIVAAVLGANRGQLVTAGLTVALAVVLHNAAGLGLGYAAARLWRLDVTRARTVAIEVGMQNSGLAVALARTHFGAEATLPGALFSIWHNLSGSLVAAWWARRR